MSVRWQLEPTHRRVGYQTEDWQAGARHLQTDIEEHMGRTKQFFEKMFGKV